MTFLLMTFRYRGYEKRKARGPSEHDMKKLEERKKKEAARRKLVENPFGLVVEMLKITLS